MDVTIRNFECQSVSIKMVSDYKIRVTLTGLTKETTLTISSEIPKVVSYVMQYVYENTNWKIKARVSVKEDEMCDDPPQYAFEILAMYPLHDEAYKTKQKQLPTLAS